MGDPDEDAGGENGGATGPSAGDESTPAEESASADDGMADGDADEESPPEGAPQEQGDGEASGDEVVGDDASEGDDDAGDSSEPGVDGGDSSEDGADDGPPATVDPENIGPVDEDGGTYKGMFPDMEEVPDSEEGGGDEDGQAGADAMDGETDAPGATAVGQYDEGGGLVDAEVGHAPDDQEQPLEEHIQEMVYRFLAVAVAMAGVAAVALLWSDDLINFLWYSFLGPGGPLCPGSDCPQTFRPHIYHPLSLVLARLKIAVLVGFVVGLPVAVFQTYLFMRPGLYPRERRYYLAAVPTSLVLATIGVLFAYALVLPALFSYFMGYSTRAAEAALGLAETFNIIVIMLGFFAIVFQIPLLVMLAIMMGVTTRRWLEDRRLYFWMGFGGVAFIFSPDPTGMAPLLVALTMIALFEGTLTLLRWTGRDSPVFAPEPMRAHRPHAIAFAALVGYAVSDLPLPTGYYDALPPTVTTTLADLGLTTWTPLLVGVGIVALFEIGFYLLRRFGGGLLRLQLALYRVRRPVWVGAVVVGYLASPDPVILDTLRATALEPVEVGAVVLGVVVLYELLVQLIVWRRG